MAQDLTSNDKPIGLGIAGLGMAGAVMVRAVACHPGFRLAAAAEPKGAPRSAFARDFEANIHSDIRGLCKDPTIDAVYIATPHQFHVEHASLAAAAGKHIILEKPMALTLADCDAIMAAVEKAGVRLVVGHTHAFDPAVRAMRAMIASGELGRLGMIASWNYTNYLYRPRRPEELDTARGGGILFNQLPHQIDIVRLLGGGLVKSVRAQAGGLDPARPTEGHAVAFLAFQDGVFQDGVFQDGALQDGAAASLVYGGYDFFDSDELHDWISERGSAKQPAHGAARRALAARTRDETELRTANYAYGAADNGEPPHQPHFGVTIATCARGELRGSANGVWLYGQDGRREIALPQGPCFSGRGNVLDDLAAAIRTGQKPVHDGRWGKATLEVTLAVRASAREGREIMLKHQVAV
ncbi:MAG TPA: Gfo/Idh/MocA family oxidoreductase [Xanthobacteraceae bacterium]|nr:Gfo/Idh/MocA family oxidoreductase [Xanthobacteraceae bacterium]